MLCTNPILFVQNAGHGETPPCEAAAYKPGAIVKVSRRKALSEFPAELVVLKAVPPHFSPDYALADLCGEPRPLMIREGKRCISYILCRESGDTTPYWLIEKDLRPSGREPLEIGTVSAEASDAVSGKDGSAAS